MRSFDSFYSEEHDGVLAMVFTMTGSWPVAEDLTEEAFARAFSRWSEVGRYDRPDSWVRTVAANLLRSRGRRLRVELKARARLHGTTEAFDPDPMPHELEQFWQAVRELPRQQALAMALHFLEDRQPSEMAEILGCSANTARVHLHRARKRLQQVLSDRDGAKDSP